MKIGTTDFSLWASKAIPIWQYCNAPKLSAIIESELAFFNTNATQFFSNWETNVFNLLTANTFGLNVWGKILGVGRPSIPAVNGGIDQNGVFRFANIDTGRWHSIWLSNASNPALNIEYTPNADSIPLPNQLGDDAYRTVLLAKLKLLYSNGSIHDINDFLQSLLGSYSTSTGWTKNEKVYIVDNYDMTMRIEFGYVPTSAELSIITTDGLSPRPMGVFLNYSVIGNLVSQFGFNEADMNTWVTPSSSGISVPEGYGNFSSF